MQNLFILESGPTDDGIDMDARHLSFHQVSLQVEDVDFGFLHEEREVVDFPNLQEEEISSVAAQVSFKRPRSL